jgi:hypothetical protein
MRSIRLAVGEFFAGAHLASLGAFPTWAGCRIDLRWDLNGTKATAILPVLDNPAGVVARGRLASS